MSLLPRTQDHLDIVDVKDDILVLTGGRFRLVAETTAINFDLLSEDEQNATIYAYANLVNSLDYPAQILVRTRRVDITSYINYLHSLLREQPSGALREQLQDYIDFVKQLVLENTVLQKRFFVVIPHWLGATVPTKQNTSLLSALPFFPKPQTAPATKYSKESLVKAKQELEQKLEDLKWQFNRLGIKTRQLKTEELIRLYYEIYNPEAGENPGINQDVYGYTTEIISSTLEGNSRKPQPPTKPT